MTKQGTRLLSPIPRLDSSAESATCFKQRLDVFGISLFRVKRHLSKESSSSSELLHEAGGERDSYIPY